MIWLVGWFQDSLYGIIWDPFFQIPFLLIFGYHFVGHLCWPFLLAIFAGHLATGLFVGLSADLSCWPFVFFMGNLVGKFAALSVVGLVRSAGLLCWLALFCWPSLLAVFAWS